MNECCDVDPLIVSRGITHKPLYILSMNSKNLEAWCYTNL